MKRKIIYPLSFLFVFAFGFFIAYQIFVPDKEIIDENEPAIEDIIDTEMLDIAEAELNEPIVELNSGTVAVDTVRQERITPSTKLVIEYLYLEDNTIVQDEMIPPYYFLDLTRDQLEKYTKDYLGNPTASDQEKDLDNFELVSFSSSKVVLRKVYDSGYKNYYQVYIDPERNIIVIENPDGSIREDINAEVNALGEEERESLKKPGRKVYSEEELLHLIESYSS
ncbi:hypothetical protein EDC18_101359 [Natranaerovirga pectinivora]|uniref:BofC-like protein n=1 Tax=Natranaerovirga pectinivora TaxID=682400 RepID=A0A4R3MRC4_9FIRM|nr:hypothetical protein [Natranaerovirga pectinivora]TCT17063.1 hypothetical protein EDC18_101359 [Natranaerovirga pectinivora]